MQSLYALALVPVAETWADPNSYGFRENRSCADAIGKCFNLLSQKYAPMWILEGDILSCFDSIDHTWILKNIPMDKKILRVWLEAGYMEKGLLYTTERGTPQGGIISPLIANMTLDGLEKAIIKVPPNRYRLGKRPAVHAVRYADDFIITACSKELLEERIRPALRDFLAMRGLTLSDEKTRTTQIENGFGFLSQYVRKYNGKLLIRPTRDAVKDMTAKTSQIIRSHRGQDALAMIKRLNPVIRGWANFHRYVCSSRTFSYIDDYIFKQLWRWARREHDNKGKVWTRKKYFRHTKISSWSFFATGTDAHGKKYNMDLYKACRTKIRRHVRIRAEANPYLPEWTEYFRQRKAGNYTSGIHKTRVTLTAAVGSPLQRGGFTGA
jgi:RNA-directed DNA polymerase